MKHVANSRFTIKSWDEKPYSEGRDLPKLPRSAHDTQDEGTHRRRQVPVQLAGLPGGPVT